MVDDAERRGDEEPPERGSRPTGDATGERADPEAGAAPGGTAGEEPESPNTGPETPGTDAEGPEGSALAELAERETAYGLLQRGQALLKRRHHAQAAVILERAAKLEPGKGSIVEALARAYYNSGQHQRAVEAFEELLTIEPSTAYGHYGLGQALKQVGRRAEARTHLRLAVALAPDSRLYRDALARLG